MSNKMKVNANSRPLVKVKNQKVSLVNQSQLVLDKPKGLGESFAITVSSGYVTTTYTIHRPIGITDLEDDDWVATLVSDIPSLLTRAEDPAQAQINKARGLLKTAELINAKLLLKNEAGTIFYPPDVSSEERNAVLEYAESEFKAYKRTVREQILKENPKVTQVELDSLKFDKSRQDFLPEAVKLHEGKIAKFLSNPDVIERIEEAVPQTYRTMSGPLMDTPQCACNAIGKTNNVAQALDKVNSWLYTNLVKGGEISPPLKKTLSDKGSVKSSGSITGRFTGMMAQVVGTKDASTKPATPPVPKGNTGASKDTSSVKSA